MNTRPTLALCATLLAMSLLADAPSGGADTDGGRSGVSPNVLEHHQNALRSGAYVVPSLTWEKARNLHRDAAFHADVAGPVYAQPLYWHPAGGAKPLLLVATEQNL